MHDLCVKVYLCALYNLKCIPWGCVFCWNGQYRVGKPLICDVLLCFVLKFWRQMGLHSSWYNRPIASGTFQNDTTKQMRGRPFYANTQRGAKVSREYGWELKQTWLPSTVCLVGLGFTVVEEDDDGGVGLDDTPSPPLPTPTWRPISDCDDEKGRSRLWRWSGDCVGVVRS